MLTVIFLILGIFIGYVSHKIFIGAPKGTIIMHTTGEPGIEPSLIVELDERPEILYDFDYVIFRVSHK